ncbi:MAG TPA: heat-inducible transcriptional repressor HrcA [Chloroflexota bacterium]|nr:heat-inducible transcriptional repressor HrcA [Chloroflexota bacterium]
MPAELTPRRQWVLKSIVEEYVSSATPVSSESVARKAATPISTATLRNEMAALEDLGLLRHPHTSAGRVPSDAGYRYYVECLMGPAELQPAERRTINHQFHQVEFSIDEWLALGRAVLAQALQNAALATPPLASRPKVRRIELVPLQEHTVLLVLMLQSGHIRQQMLPLEEPLDREALTRLSNKLSAELAGRTLAGVRKAALVALGVEREVLLAIVRAMEHTEQQGLEDVSYEGIRYIVAQPEFAQSAKLQPIVAALEHGQLLAPVLTQALTDEGVCVVIGREQPHETMRECSVVIMGYGPEPELRGVVGIVGPTRMPYWRAVPLVRFVGTLIDSLVRESLQ